MIRVSHPTGNANVRAVLGALYTAGLLETFRTTVGLSSYAGWMRMLPRGLHSELSRRAYQLPHDRICTHPWREFLRHLGRGKMMQQILRAKGCSIDDVYSDLDRHVANNVRSGNAKKIRAVYCYEDGAFETFMAAQERGLKRFYDLPIAFWETSRRLLDEEAERRPEWEPTLVGTRDPVAKLERKSSELSLADAVLCPSKFVLDSLPETVRRTKQCAVVEFGSPPLPNWQRGTTAFGKLRVLFAGSMTQRKGLADLFDAVRKLNRADVELVVLGAPVAPLEFYRSQFRDFVYESPRPHGEVLRLMSECDVFVLPSIVEGRALVQQEAMMCELPIIVTRNAGGEDLVSDGSSGFLVPIREPEILAEKIAWCADHRMEVREMGRAARLVALRYTWENYGRKVVDLIRGALDPMPEVSTKGQVAAFTP